MAANRTFLLTATAQASPGWSGVAGHGSGARRADDVSQDADVARGLVRAIVVSYEKDTREQHRGAASAHDDRDVLWASRDVAQPARALRPKDKIATRGPGSRRSQMAAPEHTHAVTPA
jgi:hypothetical protein